MPQATNVFYHQPRFVAPSLTAFVINRHGSYSPAAADPRVHASIFHNPPPSLCINSSWLPRPLQCSPLTASYSINRPQLVASLPPVLQLVAHASTQGVSTKRLRTYLPSAAGCAVPASVRHKSLPTLFAGRSWSPSPRQCSLLISQPPLGSQTSLHVKLVCFQSCDRSGLVPGREC